MDLARIAVGLVELLVGVGLFAASRLAAGRAYDKGGPMRVAHLVLHVVGIALILYGLLQLLFGLF